MASIEIFIDDEVPTLSLNDSDIFLYGAPLLVLHFSSFQLSLTKSTVLQLRQALKDGEGRINNYQRFMEAADNLKLPFAEFN